MGRAPGPGQAPQFSDALLGLFATLDPLRDRYDRLVLLPPGNGSKGEADLHHPLGRLTWTQAPNLWAVTADHAVAWQVLFTRGHLQPLRAHGTLTRAWLESSVLCRWLLDESADQAERLRRAVALQIGDYLERGKFERSTGGDNPAPIAGKSAAEREFDLRKQAKQHSIPVSKPLDYVALFDR